MAKNFTNRLLQLDNEIKKKRHPILFIIIIIIVLGLGIFFIINHRTITDKLGITMSEKDKRDKKIEDNLDPMKKYDKESGLIVSTFDERLYPSDSKKNIKIIGKKIEASSKGYTITVELSKANIDPTGERVTVKGVYIDDYQIDIKNETFDITESAVNYTFVIPKTKLDLLGINDFNNISLYLEINKDPKGNKKNDLTSYFYGTVTVKKTASVDNSIKGLLTIDETAKVKFYFYKVESDKDNNYIYFYFADKKQDVKNDLIRHKVSINKMLINDKIYDVEFETWIYPFGNSIEYIVIPRKEVDKIKKIDISFIVENYNDNEEDESGNNRLIGIYFSNQKTFNI